MKSKDLEKAFSIIRNHQAVHIHRRMEEHRKWDKTVQEQKNRDVEAGSQQNTQRCVGKMRKGASQELPPEVQ